MPERHSKKASDKAGGDRAESSHRRHHHGHSHGHSHGGHSHGGHGHDYGHDYGHHHNDFNSHRDVSQPPQAGGVVTYLTQWQCCLCGWRDNIWGTNSVCVNLCQHRACKYCKYTKIRAVVDRGYTN